MEFTDIADIGEREHLCFSEATNHADGLSWAYVPLYGWVNLPLVTPIKGLIIMDSQKQGTVFLFFGQISNHKESRLISEVPIKGLIAAAQTFVDNQQAYHDEDESGLYALPGMCLSDSPYVWLPNLGDDAPVLWDEDFVGSFFITGLTAIGYTVGNDPIS